MDTSEQLRAREADAFSQLHDVSFQMRDALFDAPPMVPIADTRLRDWIRMVDDAIATLRKAGR